MVRKILEDVSEERLREDLEKYRRMAIELGSTDAKIITAEGVLIDERVVAKCAYPKCPEYATNANCPPYAMSPAQVRKIVEKFHYAIFVKIEVPSAKIAGAEAREKKLGLPYLRKLAEITSKIESQAFYDGHHLAIGFGSASCKLLLCPKTDCRALIPGQGCRHRLMARSSMEAVGMDVFTMAARAGWDIYPIGTATAPSDIPYGLRLSLVLIR